MSVGVGDRRPVVYSYYTEATTFLLLLCTTLWTNICADNSIGSIIMRHLPVEKLRNCVIGTIPSRPLYYRSPGELKYINGERDTSAVD